MTRCGHTKYATFCSEECAMKDHDFAHEDPQEWAGECDICDEKLLALVQIRKDAWDFTGLDRAKGSI
jgi:hypothetical protein